MAGDTRLRVLVLGWTNSPHVVDWAGMLVRFGYEVHVAGRDVPDWPAVTPPNGVASWVPVPTGRIPLLKGRHLSREIGRLARRVDADVVHAHWLPEFGWIAARERLGPLVVSAWGSDVLNATGLTAKRSREALRAARIAVADSEALAEGVAALAPSPIPVTTIPWELDLERFSPGDPSRARAALGWPEAPTVLSVRQAKPLYNIDVIVDAFAEVRRTVADARLVLKHPQPTLPEEVERRVRDRGLTDVVTVVGHVEQPQLRDVLRAADVVVSMPSSDSSPRSVWEALATGVPVVVSDLPWARDELAGCEAAVLTGVDAGNLARELTRLLDDEPRRARLGGVARRLVEARVAGSRLEERVRAIYEQAMETSP